MGERRQIIIIAAVFAVAIGAVIAPTLGLATVETTSYNWGSTGDTDNVGAGYCCYCAVVFSGGCACTGREANRAADRQQGLQGGRRLTHQSSQRHSHCR